MSVVSKRAPVVVNPVIKNKYENRLSLSGEWEFALDPDDIGICEKWFDNHKLINEKIYVPGSWQGQGFGDDSNDLVWDFNLKARTFRATYKGAGWYKKDFVIPDGYKGKRLWLNFGGVHPSAIIWLNGKKIGEHNAPFVPFGFEITDKVKFSEKNILIVQVNEEARLFGLAYSCQGYWSGLYRDVEITATGDAYIDEFKIIPDVDDKRMDFIVKVPDHIRFDNTLMLKVDVKEYDNDENHPVVRSSSIKVGSEHTEFHLDFESPLLWSPEFPNLYQVDAVLKNGDEVIDAFSDRTGFVKLSTKGKHFLINDEPYYMRGTGEFISCPETGCPDTDRERWRRKLRTLRDYGYNYVRCQSVIHAPEYYDIADEVGLIIQSEMGMLGAWGSHNIWHVYQWPLPTPDNRSRLKWQWDKVVLRDVNHPSATIYCMSNEYRIEIFHPNIAWKCYHDTKAIKPNCLVIWTDGAHNDSMPEDFINDEAEIDKDTKKPVIQHEYRWWSSLPDVRIMHKYTGAIRPYGAEIALEAARRHGIAHIMEQAAECSQSLQFVEAKGKMERVRRDTPTLAGVCHFNATDGNPSPQGILDEFYEYKCTSAKTWLQTYGDTVILACLEFDQRVYSGNEKFSCQLRVSDFSHPSLKTPELSWRLYTGDDLFKEGIIEYTHIPYVTCDAGVIEVTLPDVDKPSKAMLSARLCEGEFEYSNQWDIWIYPSTKNQAKVYGVAEDTWIKSYDGFKTVKLDDKSTDEDVIITELMDEELIGYIKAGGRVILAATECFLRPHAPLFGYKEGHYYFTPPANYPPYEDGHEGTIIKDHRIFKNIPHEGFADLNFYRLITGAPPIDLEPLGLTGKDPIIRVIHKYPSARPIGYIMEFAYGKGGVIICSLDLDYKWPEARYLLNNIIEYAKSSDFKPELVVDDDVMSLISDSAMFCK